MNRISKKTSLLATLAMMVCFCSATILPARAVSPAQAVLGIDRPICAFLCAGLIENPLAYAACFAGCVLYEPK